LPVCESFIVLSGLVTVDQNHFLVDVATTNLDQRNITTSSYDRNMTQDNTLQPCKRHHRNIVTMETVIIKLNAHGPGVLE
jgi:hypothetical protein